MFALMQDGAKYNFEACLQDVLRNLQCFELLTKTSTNRKTLKEHQDNLTLNKPEINTKSIIKNLKRP
jgi:hypothetical protein